MRAVTESNKSSASVRLRMKTQSKVLSPLEVWAMSCDGFSLVTVRICA